MQRSELKTRLAILLLGVSGMLNDCVDREIFECNLAVATIADCCPEIDPTLFTCDRTTACGSDIVPVFSEDEAECVTDLSCDEVRRQGGCEDVGRLSCIDSAG